MSDSKPKHEIHITDVKTFKACRRRWNWSSPLRQNLQPNVTPVFFAVGRAVHEGLAKHYETGELPEDVFVEAMTKEMKEFETLTGPLWPEEKKRYDDSFVLGRDMLENYRRIVHEYDMDSDWRPVATELKFKVPIYTPEGEPDDEILLAGTFDGVFEKRSTGELWLREYKTSARKPEPRWLDLDEQCAIYCWAAQQILGRPITGVLYRFLMKTVPEAPRRLDRGGFSRAINSNLHTTYDIYKQTLEQEAFRLADLKFKVTRHTVGDNIGMIASIEGQHAKWEDWMSGTEHDMFVSTINVYNEFAMNRLLELLDEYDDVLSELAKRPPDEYVTEIEVRKSQQEINACAQDLWVVGREMINSATAMYPAPDWLKCSFCPFLAPCKAMNAGARYEVILDSEYRRRDQPTPIEADNKVEW